MTCFCNFFTFKLSYLGSPSWTCRPGVNTNHNEKCLVVCIYFTVGCWCHSYFGSRTFIFALLQVTKMFIYQPLKLEPKQKYVSELWHFVQSAELAFKKWGLFSLNAAGLFIYSTGLLSSTYYVPGLLNVAVDCTDTNP